MNTAAEPTPLQSSDTLPAVDARSPLQSGPAILALAALALWAATVIALWNFSRHPAPVPLAPPPLAELKHLPALPQDIAAHGGATETLLPPDKARQQNAAVPFAGTPLAIAKPFAFTGSAEDRARATQCLATATLYEAGDDTDGERAVAQVVLNRVRHAAFPSTVCGVVYQGAGRSTGCQFSFTCDGSLSRIMPAAAWKRAREVAADALGGAVDKRVGLATHYHTDWVYPYWSPQLTKLAQVRTHLFFGWPGAWGGPAAFGRAYRGGEPSSSAPPAAATAAPAVPTVSNPPQLVPGRAEPVPLYGTGLKLSDPSGKAYGLLAGTDATAAKLISVALALCTQPGECAVTAWGNPGDIPKSLPVPPSARRKIVFEFVRGAGAEPAVIHFDCKRFPTRNRTVCL